MHGSPPQCRVNLLLTWQVITFNIREKDRKKCVLTIYNSLQPLEISFEIFLGHTMY